MMCATGPVDRHFRREVVWLPSYGAEKRGGSVGCNVTISDEKIGALSITRPTAAIAMNQVSAVKLEKAMQPGGMLVINSSLVSSEVSRVDIRVAYVPASQIAMEMGNDSVANLVTLRALVAGCPEISRTSIAAVMDTMFAKNRKALESNQQAFSRGLSFQSPL